MLLVATSETVPTLGACGVLKRRALERANFPQALRRRPAQSADEPRHSAGNGNGLTHGMGYGLRRFSTLAQINKDAVRRLSPRRA